MNTVCSHEIEMKSVQVGVFKAEFSEILQQVKDQGETFVIEFGKNHKKVAMLVPYRADYGVQSARVFGPLKGRASFAMANNFEISDEEMMGDE